MELTLKEFLRLMLKRWWILLLTFIVGAAGVYLFAVLGEKPQYRSEAVFIVDYKGDTTASGSSSVASSDLAYSRSLSSNFVVLLQQNKFEDVVRAAVLEKHGNEYAASDLVYSASYESSLDTPKIVAAAVSGSAELSYKVAIILQDEIVSYLMETYPGYDSKAMSIGTINTVVQAGGPMATNNKLMYAVVGGLIGIIAAGAVVFLVDKYDVRVKGEKDLAARYDLPILGVIPSFTVGDKTSNRSNV